VALDVQTANADNHMPLLQIVLPPRLATNPNNGNVPIARSGLDAAPSTLTPPPLPDAPSAQDCCPPARLQKYVALAFLKSAYSQNSI